MTTAPISSSHSSTLQDFFLHIKQDWQWDLSVLGSGIPFTSLAGRSCMDVSTLGPYGGQRRFIQTKALQQGYTLQTHQAISSLTLWIITLSSFSITLRTDKKRFREILSQHCHFNPTDAKVIFILFLLN